MNSTHVVSVPAFYIETMYVRGRKMTKFQVQDAEHGTFGDFFETSAAGRTWLEGVLVAYFGYSLDVALSIVKDAYSAACRVGLADRFI